MCFKIVIPSHKRAERVLSKNIVTNPIICVPKSQECEYREHNPETEIVTHPDSIIGLVAKRNWMVEHFGELFMIDDDVVAVQPLYKPITESTAVIKSPQEVRLIIEKLWRIASMMGIHLFGFGNMPNPLAYKPFKPYTLSKGVTGCSYGVIKSVNTIWPEELKLKEDFWISCYLKYTERKVLIDNRYYFHQKDTFISGGGGLSAIRNKDTEKESILYVKKSFGDVIRKKQDGYLKNSTQAFNIVMNFPF